MSLEGGAVQPQTDTPDARDHIDPTGLLFHRLNNQLGISLAHAELLEAKAADEAHKLRAAQVIQSILEAMGTAREIRTRLVSAPLL